MLLLACEELLQDLRRTDAADDDWRVGALRRLRQSLLHDLESLAA